MSVAVPHTNRIFCKICNAVFPSRNLLFRHLKLQHPTELNDNAVAAAAGTIQETMSNMGKIYTVSEDTSFYRVVSKPQYIATMGGKGETLINSDSMLIDGAITFKKAVPCHRLDKATGGLVVCSKNKYAERLIKASFSHHQVRKRYRAIVVGKLEPLEGKIDNPLDDKPSLTKFKVLEHTRSSEFEWITTLDLFPISGRRHQLRRHLQQIGHPIVGDQRYTPTALWPSASTIYANTLFLWSLEVEFPDPSDMFNYIGLDTLTNDALSRDEKQAIFDKAYENCKKIHVMIDEPAYYESFRRSQEAAFNK